MFEHLSGDVKRPTPHQEVGLKELLAWWQLPKDHPQWQNCVLSAAAGCGKTFLTKHFTSSLKNCYPMFVATTNEAARQMDLAGVNCKGTLHAALGLIPMTNCEVPYFIQGELPDQIKDHNLLVVDEASMAGFANTEDPATLPLVVNYALEVGMRILWIGDSYQLPPVESTNGLSPVFSMGFYTVSLTEIVRNSGEVLEYCTKLRNMIDQKSRSFPKPPRGKETIKTITPFALRATLTDHDALEDFRAGKLRIIAWRNTTVDRYNEMIRVGLHGAELAKTHKLLPTDQVLFIKPVIGGDFPEDVMKLVGNKALKQVASVNTRAEVVSLQPKELYGIECNFVKFRVEGGTEVAGYVMTTMGAAKFAQLERAFKKNLEKLKSQSAKSSQWQWWHAFDACFIKLKHSYAITTHRSQGSNIEKVIVDAKDILSASWNQPLLAYKMAYTACSRTKKQLTLVLERQMSLLKQLVALAETEEGKNLDVSTDTFFKAQESTLLSRRTITDDEFAALKKQVSDLRQQIMQGTFEPTTDKLRTIVAWFRASREEGFTVVPEKKKKEPAAAKPKRVSKKAKIEQLLQGNLEDLL